MDVNEFPWQKAKVDSNLTPEEAIETALERLADLFETLNGFRPVRPNEPAHITLVRWTPILADYLHFARRAGHAEEERRKAEDDRERRMNEVEEERALRFKAVGTLRSLEKELREAVKILDKRGDS